MTEEDLSSVHPHLGSFQPKVLGRKGLRFKFARFPVSVFPKLQAHSSYTPGSHNMEGGNLFIASDLNEKRFC